MDNITGDGWTTLAGDPAGIYHFGDITSIFVDVAGRIYVTDFAYNSVVRMSSISGGDFTMTGGRVTAPDITGYPLPNGESFSAPSDVSVDVAGHMFIADAGHNRIVYMEDASGTGFQ